MLTGLEEVADFEIIHEWEKTTDCPGWSVKDNLSHIIGTEATILGRPAPDHDPGEKPWIRNPVGAGNEIHVDYRRSRTPSMPANPRPARKPHIHCIRGQGAVRSGHGLPPLRTHQPVERPTL